MPISYKKLFMFMDEKGIKKFDLRKQGLHSVVIEKLKVNKNVDVSTIAKLCKILDCQPGDIMEYIPDEKMEQDNPAPPATTQERIHRTATEESPKTEIIREKPKTTKESPASIQAFTPETREVVDLERLATDIRYQLAVRDTFGMDILSDLLDEARNMQEPEQQKSGTTAGE